MLPYLYIFVLEIFSRNATNNLIFSEILCNIIL
nr:MAG TPA: hypothetical protein [Bacteriophage sp.]